MKIHYIKLHILFWFYTILSIISKRASEFRPFSSKFCLFYGIILFGMLIYAILWQQILKKIPIVTAHANKAITVIWGILCGKLFFNEIVTFQKLIGGAIIIVGICLIVFSEKRTTV